jgi:hypothetical protein
MKSILTFIILLFISLPTTSQSSGFGIKSGVSIASTNKYFSIEDEDPAISAKNGLTAGISIENQINNTLSFQYEVIYESKGFYFPADVSNDGGGNIFGYFNQEYFTVPLMVKATVGKAVKYYGYTGLYGGFLVGAENHITSIAASFNGQTIRDLSYCAASQFKRFDLGGILGTGIRTSASERVDFVFDVRCSAGFINMAKKNQPDLSSHWHYVFNDERNISLSITAGIVFRLDE